MYSVTTNVARESVFGSKQQCSLLQDICTVPGDANCHVSPGGIRKPFSRIS
jgi:hypothetical protein